MTSASRRGFTLVELAISMTLLLVVGGAVAATVSVAWRTHDQLQAERRARQAVGEAADLLRAEVRPASPAAGDLIAVSDTAVELLATIGASVICTVAVARDRVTLPPRRPTAGAPLTWWRDLPAPGDSVDVLNGRGAMRDTLSRHELVGMHGGTCPLATGLVRASADAASAIELELAPPLPQSIGVGAPLRFLRQTRYSLYRSATDARWYLGIRERVGAGWTLIQPVTGAFAPAASGGAGGMAVRLLDTAGAVVSTGAFGGVRAVDITLRAAPGPAPRAPGRATPVAESLRVIVATRNER